MGGSRSFSPDKNNATSDAPSNICDGAMPRTMAADDANVSHVAANNICGRYFTTDTKAMS